MDSSDNHEIRGGAAAPAGLGLMAAALSLLLPGAGQLMIRHWGRAAVWFAGWIAIAAVTSSAHNGIIFVLMVASALDAYFLARIDARDAGGEPGRGPAGA